MSWIERTEKEHLKNIRHYQALIDKAYRDVINMIANMEVPEGEFMLASYPEIRQRLELMFRALNKNILHVTMASIRSEWILSNEKNNELARRVFSSAGYRLDHYHKKDIYVTNRYDGLEAFLNRQKNGLKLSDRVWNYTNMYKKDIELVLEHGILNGRDSHTASLELMQYLKNPQGLYNKIREKDGSFIYESPGRGVYRSPYKNAMRLAGTETNIAYHTADFERWQGLDFVVGQLVELSNDHTLNGKPFTDMCDDLQGRYPKEFKFLPWHPQCRCHSTPILATEKELDQIIEAQNRGLEIPKSQNRVEALPGNFREWMRTNSGKMNNGKTIPYFIQENAEVIFKK